ncbi:44302_t:CDS:2, partial [Gigaspora margarita]
FSTLCVFVEGWFISSRWLYEKYQDKDLGTQLLVNLPTLIVAYSLSHTAKKVFKKYITEKGHLLVKNTISASYSGQETNVLKECSKSDIIETLPTRVSNPINK